MATYFIKNPRIEVTADTKAKPANEQKRYLTGILEDPLDKMSNRQRNLPPVFAEGFVEEVRALLPVEKGGLLTTAPEPEQQAKLKELMTIPFANVEDYYFAPDAQGADKYFISIAAGNNNANTIPFIDGATQINLNTLKDGTLVCKDHTQVFCRYTYETEIDPTKAIVNEFGQITGFGYRLKLDDLGRPVLKYLADNDPQTQGERIKSRLWRSVWWLEDKPELLAKLPVDIQRLIKQGRDATVVEEQQQPPVEEQQQGSGLTAY